MAAAMLKSRRKCERRRKCEERRLKKMEDSLFGEPGVPSHPEIRVRALHPATRSGRRLGGLTSAGAARNPTHTAIRGVTAVNANTTTHAEARAATTGTTRRATAAATTRATPAATARSTAATGQAEVDAGNFGAGRSAMAIDREGRMARGNRGGAGGERGPASWVAGAVCG